jgi:hypothetical protein
MPGVDIESPLMCLIKVLSRPSDRGRYISVLPGFKCRARCSCFFENSWNKYSMNFNFARQVGRQAGTYVDRWLGRQVGKLVGRRVYVGR